MGLVSILQGAVQAADPAPDTAAEPTAPADIRPPLVERSQADAQALSRSVPKAEQQMLQAGEDSFLALWKPAEDSDPAGAVVLVPGAGENADWPTVIGPLRQKFPHIGWHSLSVTLPDLLADAPQARIDTPTATPTQGQNTAGAPAKATPDDANANIAQATAGDPDAAQGTTASEAAGLNDAADAERIFARLDAAVAYAEQQQARAIVLIGHGSGAYWAARYLSERQPAQVQKLVMVAAQTPARVEQGLETVTPTLKLPVADLYYATRERDRRAAQARLQVSKRQKDSQYRQLSLIAMPGNQEAEQEQLFRRVRGWMMPSP